MATAVDKNTDIGVFQKELKKKRATYGYTSNKYGRIVLVNKEAYENMLRNNDTLRDKNGLNDVFANLDPKDLESLKKCNKMKDREKANATKDEIIVKAVSKLRNFMEKLHAEEIDDEKTRLSDTVLEELRGMEVSVVDNSAELEEKDAEIEALKAQLAEAKKAPKTAKKAKKVAKAEDADTAEDDAEGADADAGKDTDTGTTETDAGADAGATGDAGTDDDPFKD